MSPLSWIKQDDYAAGTLRSIGRDQDVGIGVWNSINGMYDDDGDVYLRGPTQFYSKNRLPHGLTFLWSGVLTNWALLASTQTKLYGLSGYDLVPFSGTALTRPVRPAVIKDEIFLPNGVSWKGGGTTPQENQLPPSLPGATGTIHLAACAGRLVVGQGRFVRFSGFNADGSSNAHQWSATDYHELPEGTVIAGLAAIHDTLLVFTSYGVWAIHNLALDLTDDSGNPQHVVSKIIPELALLHESGLTEWAGSVIAPCTDRCYMIDVDKAPVPISDSIAPLYAKHIRARRLPGGAKAFRNHLFLPWLNRDGTVASVMVCRLNRPVRGRLVYFPWSIMGGHAAKMVAGDISGLEAVPQLLSAHQDGSITSFQGLFESMRAVGRDADGTIPIFDLETRDFPTGTGQPNHVRGIRLHYTLDALPGEPIPGIDTSISSGDPVSQTYAQLLTTGTYQDVLNTYANYDNAHRGLGWPTSLPPGEWTDDDERYWPILTPPAPPSDGRNPAKWPLPRTIRTRWVRGRFVCDDPVARLIVHKDEFGVRPATHYR